jgi:hypothetical protein
VTPTDAPYSAAAAIGKAAAAMRAGREERIVIAFFRERDRVTALSTDGAQVPPFRPLLRFDAGSVGVDEVPGAAVDDPVDVLVADEVLGELGAGRR